MSTDRPTSERAATERAATDRLLAEAYLRALTAHCATAVAEPRLGWRARTLTVPVALPDRSRAFLRLVRSTPALARGSWWTGTADAETISGVHKPSLVAVEEWQAGGWAFRAELMTMLDGTECSRSPELREDPGLSAEWWNDLSAGLRSIESAETPRSVTTANAVEHRIRLFAGDRLDTHVTRWSTAHGDLQWSNVLGPRFAVVDWEAWGRAPAHLDLATLYVHALLVPAVTTEMDARFGAELRSGDGRLALAFAATKVLTRAASGDYPHLILPVHRLLDRLASASAGASASVGARARSSDTAPTPNAIHGTATTAPSPLPHPERQLHI